MLQHTNRTNLQRESWLENQHTISAACDTAEQLPHLQRVVMYTPPLFFFFSNCLLIHILSRKQQSYTAASFSQHSDTKMEGSNNKQNKVMWLKAGCGAPPSCVQAHPVILRHSRQKQHPKARWLGSCCIYSGL